MSVFKLSALCTAEIIDFNQVVELSNSITCTRTSKWSKSTCPFKIYLPENLLFLISQKNNNKKTCCGFLLEEPRQGAYNEYTQHVFFEKFK